MDSPVDVMSRLREVIRFLLYDLDIMNKQTTVNIDPVEQVELSVAVLLLPQFSLLPLGGFLDALRHAADEADRSRQRYCRWQLCSIDGAAVRASCGAELAVDRALSDLSLNDLDYLVVHAGLLEGLQGLPEELYQMLRDVAAKDLPLVGLDSGTFALAQSGLMRGYKAAVHWRHLGDYVSRFPDSPAVSDQLLVVDRSRTSCPGGAAAIELAVALLTRHCGRRRALKGMADLQVEGPRAQAKLERGPSVEDPRLQRVISLMQAQLAQPLTSAKLAQRVGLSTRQLDRLFQMHFNQSARSYYMQLRLQQARWAVEHSVRSFSLIADQTGFCDSAHLLRNFRAQYGETPGALRRLVRQQLPLERSVEDSV